MEDGVSSFYSLLFVLLHPFFFPFPFPPSLLTRRLNVDQYAGSELLAGLIKLKASEKIEVKYPHLTEDEKLFVLHEAVKCYRQGWRTTWTGQPLHLGGLLSAEVGAPSFSLVYTEEESTQMYQQAIGISLAALHERIRHMSQEGSDPGDTTVVFNGGTFKNIPILEATKYVIERAGMQVGEWLNKTSDSGRS